MTDAGRGPSAPQERRILLLIGPVGAGKGTQAELLRRRLGVVHLASGDLFRSALREGSELGERARAFMERGDLVPDEITIAMFMAELARPRAAAGAILDGFPRTVAQARALDATLAGNGERIQKVISLEVPIEEIVARAAGRRVCPTCGSPYQVTGDPPRVAGICDKDGTRLVQRDDDRPEVVRARLAKQTPPMLEVLAHYDRAGIVARIDGTGSAEQVSMEIMRVLAADAGRA